MACFPESEMMMMMMMMMISQALGEYEDDSLLPNVMVRG
jgi:hypothetical protein